MTAPDTAQREFDPVELHHIAQMVKASKTLPDDFFAVEAMQELACLLAVLEPLLTNKQTALMVGVGGYLAHIGKTEMTAGIQAYMELQKAMRNGHG